MDTTKRFGTPPASFTPEQKAVATNFDAIADIKGFDIAMAYLCTRYGGKADPTVMLDALGIHPSGDLQNIYRGYTSADSDAGRALGLPANFRAPVINVTMDGARLLIGKPPSRREIDAREIFTLPVPDTTRMAVRPPRR